MESRCAFASKDYEKKERVETSGSKRMKIKVLHYSKMYCHGCLLEGARRPIEELVPTHIYTGSGSFCEVDKNTGSSEAVVLYHVTIQEVAYSSTLSTLMLNLHTSVQQTPNSFRHFSIWQL